jgi:hypothetical protein
LHYNRGRFVCVHNVRDDSGATSNWFLGFVW